MSEVICRDKKRQEQVRQQTKLNGLDYLEVGGTEKPETENQKILRVYFFSRLSVDELTEKNIIIEGGRRIRDIQVQDVKVCWDKDADEEYLRITVDKTGDFSAYTLRVIQPPLQKGKLDQDEKRCRNPKCPQPSPQTGHSLDMRQCGQVQKLEKISNEKDSWIPHPNFDQRYNSIEFSFKVNCTDGQDCKQNLPCPPEPLQEPDINYLTKDYARFRRLMLDRLSLTMPEWKERHVPDIGITLVELLAYAGDHLSYYQDAVATEAYLDTSRRRISVRRHARLVDYTMHEGCNARAWVHLAVNTDFVLNPKKNYFITRVDGTSSVLSHDDLRYVQAGQYEVFEPLGYDKEISFYADHNTIKFYTWGDQACCLPRGATSATLRDMSSSSADKQPDNSCGGKESQKQSQQQQQEPIQPELPKRILSLQEKDVLLFEEIIGPKTGYAADADPRHRHVVRLTEVKKDVDRLTHTPVLEIKWAEEDALPFPLCISSLGQAPNCEMILDISVARGNIILVDHGRKVDAEDLGIVPGQEGGKGVCIREGRPADQKVLPGSYRPALKEAPLTFSQPLSLAENISASAMLVQNVRQALPQISLTGILKTAAGKTAGAAQQEGADSPAQDQTVQHQIEIVQHDLPAQSPDCLDDLDEQQSSAWQPQPDLLASGPDDRHFVVEMDNDGRAHLRFGDDEFGEQPEADMHFQADYRIGNGPSGNVGANSIAHLVLRNGLISGAVKEVRNPLPAQGGTAAEPMEQAKLFAPRAFLKEQQRAITAEDYATIVEREFSAEVQRAVARLRWNGSWHEVQVAVDPLGQDEADQELLDRIQELLHRYRRVGHEVMVKSAQLVPLHIEMTIRVLPTYLRGHVQPVLQAVFSDGLLPDGSRGFFHPDNLSFGDGIRLSRLAAVAQRVDGVESVEVTKLERLNLPSEQALEDGILPLGPFEIARLDNDPNYPENGILKLNMTGGRK